MPRRDGRRQEKGTGVSREGTTDVNGEFVLSALANGPYTVKIELTGFRTLENRGMQLGAGQTVRRTFALQVGTLAETVTVAEKVVSGATPAK